MTRLVVETQKRVLGLQKTKGNRGEKGEMLPSSSKVS
jgi:hypothetical protein